MKTKLCKKCGIEKPLSEMVKNTRLRDGVTSACGKCHSKQYYTSKDPKEKNCLKCRGIFIGTGRQKYCSDHCCDSHYRFLNREKKADYNRRYRHSYERKKHLTKTVLVAKMHSALPISIKNTAVINAPRGHYGN